MAASVSNGFLAPAFYRMSRCFPESLSAEQRLLLPSSPSLAKVWKVDSCAPGSTLHIITFSETLVCTTEQVFENLLTSFHSSFFYKDFKDKQKKKVLLDFSASLSVANEVKALYCHSACNKERMETVESPVKVCLEFTSN